MTNDRVSPDAQTTTAVPVVATIGDSWLLAPDATREEQLRALWAMTARERVSAMRAGGLTLRHQLFAWVARYPDE